MADPIIQDSNQLIWKANVTSSSWNPLENLGIEEALIFGCLAGLFLIFILPFFGSIAFAFSIYFSEFILWWYTRKTEMNSGYSQVDNQHGTNIIIKLFDWIAWLWHGYEIKGWENLPDGPAILVSFNGALTIDQFYFMMELHKRDLRSYSGIIRNNYASMKFRQRFNRVFNLAPFTRDECCTHLREGGYLSVAPGGFEESRYSRNYQTNFRGRHGFAQVALDTEVPIIPIFTRNIQEAFWIPWFLKPFVSGIFELKYIPILPVGGGLPVKLVTYIGKPIDYDVTYTAKELAKKVCSELQALIDEHQDMPGNTIRALYERLTRPSRDVVKTTIIDNEADNSVVNVTAT